MWSIIPACYLSLGEMNSAAALNDDPKVTRAESQSTRKDTENSFEDTDWRHPANMVNLQPFLDARILHGPIFRRELFYATYAAYHANRSKNVEKHDPPEPTKYDEVFASDIYGIDRSILVPRGDALVERTGKKVLWQRCWRYRNLQDLGTTYLHQ